MEDRLDDRHDAHHVEVWAHAQEKAVFARCTRECPDSCRWNRQATNPIESTKVPISEINRLWKT